MKSSIREIIIVEGKHDVSAVRRAVNAILVTTGGYHLPESRLQHIVALAKHQDIIILTDPDGPGERIRQKLQRAVPQAKHARLKLADARSAHNGTIGVAHAKPEAIYKALKKAGATFTPPGTSYQLSDLMSWQLSGCHNAAERRRRFCAVIGFEPLDAANLCLYLNACNVSEADIRQVLQQIEQE